jgi:hypothetical protein
MQGMPLEIRMATKGSSKMLMTIKSGEMNLQTVVINGETGKASGMMGEKELSEEEIKTYLNDAVIYEELNWSKDNTKLIHIEEIDGHKVYKMEIVNLDLTVTHNYYDITSGLKYSSVSIQDTPEGPMVSTSVYKEYKAEGDYMYPATVIEDNAGQVMELHVEKIQIGGTVSDSVFKQ